MESKSELVEFAADIVAAYVGNNSVPATELPSLINDVIRALTGAVSPGGEPVPEEARPAVPIKKSVTPDFIICLEDGKKFKSLKRHLRTAISIGSQNSVISLKTASFPLSVPSTMWNMMERNGSKCTFPSDKGVTKWRSLS